MFRIHLIACALLMLFTNPRFVVAQFQEIIIPTEWQAAAGQWTTIDFTGHAFGEIVGDSYASLGVHFPEADDSFYTAPRLFADDWGLRGSFGLDPDDSISVLFDSPQYAVAVHHPGSVHIEIYADDLFLYATQTLDGGVLTDFTGLVSTIAFNRVRIIDPFGFVVIDDLHFGGVPAPGALPLLVTVLLYSRRRRS